MPTQDDRDPLLGAVEDFISRSGQTPTAFGRSVLGDPMLVFDLRTGRELRRATADRVLAYIRDTNLPHQPDAHAEPDQAPA